MDDMTLEEAANAFNEIPLASYERRALSVLRAHIDTITAQNAALRAERDAIDAACLAVCSDNTPEVLGGEADADLGRYLCLNENGDALIDTDDPAEVVRGLADLWRRVSEQLTALRSRVEAVAREYETVELDEFSGESIADDIYRVLRRPPRA